MCQVPNTAHLSCGSWLVEVICPLALDSCISLVTEEPINVIGMPLEESR